jgi:NAD(P)H-hydrate epimerase
MCDALRGGVPKAVVDADALALLAGHPEAWNLLPRESVLTPHPGEAALILGTTAATVQSDRPAALRALVEKTGATVVLKGAGTLVGAPGRGRHLLRGGNPGMATGGSGDVLAGMIGGLLAQGLDAWSAARAGVWAHARNGDEAAWYKGEAFLLARDLF